MDYAIDRITYDNFINRELILFSHADNQRSLPHYMDGFKPSQRKVLFACFKRNLRQEIKVAQLAGYISEHSAYHHGEASLTQTIIGMAQNFVGSNNINLLSPCGQFGTRLLGGKDAASPRYVFTKLEAITRYVPYNISIKEYARNIIEYKANNFIGVISTSSAFQVHLPPPRRPFAGVSGRRRTVYRTCLLRPYHPHGIGRFNWVVR